MKQIHAGILMRNQTRRMLMSYGIEFKENKGLLDSMFYFECSDKVMKEIKQRIDAYNE